MMSRNAVLYFNGTFVFTENGAHARTSELLDFLIGACDRVAVMSYRNHPDCPWSAKAEATFKTKYPKAELALFDWTAKHKIYTRLKNLLAQTVPASISLFPAFDRILLPAELKFLQKMGNDAILYISYADGFLQIPQMGGMDKIVETHDLTFLNYAIARNIGKTSLRTLGKLRKELEILSRVQIIVAISEAESHFYSLFLDKDRVSYVPSYNSKDIDASAYGNVSNKFDLLFVASDNVLNIRGLMNFLSQSKGWIDNYSIALCGKICGSQDVIAYGRAHPNVHLLGYVDDINRLHLEARAALAPVDGTGLKIKILDALRCGRPVLASSSAMTGLVTGYDGCVLPITRQNVERLVSDHASWTSACTQAAKYYSVLTNNGGLDKIRALIRPDPAISAR